MDEVALSSILKSIEKARIGVIGDFTLDAYWLLDTGTPEDSIETGKPTEAVVRQKYSLGGAGNVVCNLVDLKVGSVFAFGVISGDIFGREMLKQQEDRRVNVDGMVLQESGWDTPVYAKPYIGMEEQNRIDFGRFNVLGEESGRDLIERLSGRLPEIDVLIINQQLPRGIYSPGVVSSINRLVMDYPGKIFLLDSRNRSEEFEGMTCKVNATEAARMCGERKAFTEFIPIDQLRKYAVRIYERMHKPVYITRSGRGIILFDGTGYTEIPGIQILKRIDPVGAGDTTVSAIAAVLAAGGDHETAGTIGNLAAAVTIQKLQQTGTASQDEIKDMWANANYVFNPEIADDIRRAKYLEGSEIEIITRDSFTVKIENAIFDHDGTISVLRQGWETIMEPVMLRSILGDTYDSADEETYHRVRERVREYIDRSTGIETILQMQALAEMVREFGFVPDDRILGAEGYKEIYNKALMKHVDRRLKKLEAGELDPADFVIKGVVKFLEELHEHGIKLYLASGTDQDDVVREARCLGYAQLFAGRIYGYTGGETINTKRRVVQGLIGNNKLQGRSLICFGDGPVELRETKRFGGTVVGVASDEVRRYGLDVHKRARLVKAGADMVVPDFSQGEKLLQVLFGR